MDVSNPLLAILIRWTAKYGLQIEALTAQQVIEYLYMIGLNSTGLAVQSDMQRNLCTRFLYLYALVSIY